VSSVRNPDQQNIDTTTPMGKLLFQITGFNVIFLCATGKQTHACAA